MQLKSEKILVVFVGAVLTAAFLTAGCGGRDRPAEANGEKIFEDAVVRVACPNQVVAEIIRRFGQAWSLREKAKVEAVLYDPDQGPESAGDCAVFIVRPYQLGRWASSQRLAAVPERLIHKDRERNWGDLLPLYREKLLVWNRTTYAVPLLGEAPLCYYRSDLFKDPKHVAAFRAKYDRDLAAPATWEQFADLAAYFHDHWHEGKKTPSLPPLPLADDDLATEFFQVAVPFARRAIPDDGVKRLTDDEFFSFHYDLKTGKARLAEPGFVHALQLLQQLQGFRLPGQVADPAEAFGDGRAVLCLAEASWLKRFRAGDAMEVRFDCCSVPGSQSVFDFKTGAMYDLPEANLVPYLGASGWLAVVPSSTELQDAAFSLLAELTSKETSRQIVLDPQWGGGGYRLEHFSVPSAWYGLQPNSQETPKLIQRIQTAVTHPSIQNPVLCLRIPDAQAHQKALVKAIRSALLEAKDPKAALTEAVKEWDALDSRLPLAERKKNYRISLGLRP